MRRGTVEAAATRVSTTVLLAACCTAVAAVITGAIHVPLVSSLPAPLILACVVVFAASPILVHRWRALFWTFVVWLFVEDLVRKFLGNDLRVFFLKDFLFLLLVVGLVMDRSVRGLWVNAVGSARVALYALIAWSIVMAIPMLFVDWRVSAIGLRLDFAYVPLVLPGYIYSREPGGARKLLAGIAVLGIPACIVGVVQATIGPTFLRPSVATPGLVLNQFRAYDVFQPTGTFADPKRFGMMALLTLVAALCLIVSGWNRGDLRYRLMSVGALVAGAVGLFVSAWKAGLIIATVVVLAAVLAPSLAERRMAMFRAAAVACFVVLAIVVMFWALPQLSNERSQYLAGALSPAASSNEWSYRLASWIDNAERGFAGGGLIGQGTGVSSLGLQYLGKGDAGQVTGVPSVEGGYAAIALEWGFVGAALWTWWLFAWFRRGITILRASGGGPDSVAGYVLLAWMVAYFIAMALLGQQYFQNYYANAYFWLLSGLVFGIRSAHPESRNEPPNSSQSLEVDVTT